MSPGLSPQQSARQSLVNPTSAFSVLLSTTGTSVECGSSPLHVQMPDTLIPIGCFSTVKHRMLDET